MKMSRPNWYRLLALFLAGLVIYDRVLGESRSRELREAVRCLLQKNGDSSLCPRISVDPMLQPSIQSKFDLKFNQTEPTISIHQQDEIFEVQIQSSQNTGLVLGITSRSTTDYQVVSWRELEQGEES